MPIQNTIEALFVSELSYRYGKNHVLDRVTFTRPQGSVTALVGPNGAGKTTLIRQLLGLLPHQKGEIAHHGLSPHQHRCQLNGSLGYQPDRGGCHLDMTIRQNLSYTANLHGLSADKAEQAIAEGLNKLELARKADIVVKNLSRGWRQRVAIVQATIHQPRFIAMDEPSSGLDADAREQLGDLIDQLKKQGTCLIVSSHILSEMDRYATHLLVLDQGKVLEDQTLQAVTSDLSSIRLIFDLLPGETHKSKMANLLENSPDCDEISMEQVHTVSCLYSGTLKDRNMFLRYLFEHNAPIIAVREKSPSLLDTYQKHIRNESKKIW
ncbi:ABC transporter ATP-binding protein [Magnetococcus sp. PR-3]|uniref:ABC transporter ATP-binding protein n=1 Tax=Magnetococcus sp. PR-3 TaxID=3120355 RepID=UPI002FCE61CB